MGVRPFFLHDAGLTSARQDQDSHSLWGIRPSLRFYGLSNNVHATANFLAEAVPSDERTAILLRAFPAGSSTQ